MQVTVRWFAMLREQRGVELETLEIQPGTTLRALYERLIPTGPGGRIPVAYARNLAYAAADEVVADGDEIAFLPPVGGG